MSSSSSEGLRADDDDELLSLTTIIADPGLSICKMGDRVEKVT